MKIYYKEQFIGETTDSQDPLQFLEFANIQDIDPTQIKVEMDSSEKKYVIRDKIKEKVGDELSILGVIADTSTILIDLACIHILSLDKSNDEQMKQAHQQNLAQIYGADWETMTITAKKWIDNRSNQKIQTTTKIKGIEKIFSDVATKATAVTNIIENT